MKISQIETPALILEKSIFEENIRTMKALMAKTNMALRPHYKSHKCPVIARRQIAEGAKGIVCAKLSEAEDLAQCGIADILIANQIVQPEKLGRLGTLAKKCRLTVCVDCEENILELEKYMAAADATLYCLVEYEIGMGRCGVESHEEVMDMAKLISAQPHLVFEGVQAYAGNMAHEPELSVRKAETERIEQDLSLLKEALSKAGFAPKEISGGSTGTVETKPAESMYTEMQCGSYIFMDRAYRDLSLGFRNALFLLTTVVSVKKDRIVTDGGTKSLGMDQGNPVFVSFEDAPVQMSEEHAQCTAMNHGLSLKDKIRLIPGHCCTTVNLHEKIYVVDGEDVVDIWPVTSRGKSQ